MIRIETTAEVITTCILTDEDEVITTCILTDEDAEKVKVFMKKNQCDLENAVKELFLE